MKKTISILGSTGSIGLTALKIIEKKKNLFNLNIFSANKNYKLILNKIKKYKPKYFIVSETKIFKIVKKNKIKNVKFLINLTL